MELGEWGNTVGTMIGVDGMLCGRLWGLSWVEADVRRHWRVVISLDGAKMSLRAEVQSAMACMSLSAGGRVGLVMCLC